MSTPSRRRGRFLTMAGSQLPLRSRGTPIWTRPTSSVSAAAVLGEDQDGVVLIRLEDRVSHRYDAIELDQIKLPSPALHRRRT